MMYTVNKKYMYTVNMKIQGSRWEYNPDKQVSGDLREIPQYMAKVQLKKSWTFEIQILKLVVYL